MKKSYWFYFLIALAQSGYTNVAFAEPHVIEAESLILTKAQAQSFNDASGKVVIFNTKGAQATGTIELTRGVYEVVVDMVAQSEHNDAIRVTVGGASWRTATWTYGKVAQSHSYTLTILPEKKTYPISVEFVEPGVFVDRISIKPLVTPSTIAQWTKAAKKDQVKPVDIVIEAESLKLSNTKADVFKGASGKVVAFHQKGAQATGEANLPQGVYRVHLDMVSKDEHNDAIYVEVGTSLLRTVSWAFGELGESKGRTLTSLETKPVPLTIRFAEPGVLVDRITFHPLLSPAVIAQFETKPSK